MLRNDKIIEIKSHIDDLHKKNKGDYQSLMRQVAHHYKPIQYNFPQMLASFAAKKFKQIYLEWSRGTGKSTDLGRQKKDVVIDMPRSSNMLIGNTYKDMLTRTLPSTIAGLEAHGIFQNLHYFIRQKPPPKWRKSWPTAFQPPDEYDKYITYWTGAGYHLISQDVPGDGRGLNTDSECKDEAALQSKEKHDTNTTPTMRGSKKSVFENSPFFRSSYNVSSTPLTLSGRWFIEMEEAAIKNPGLIKFISANAKWNKQNLADNWLEEQKDLTLPWIYDAEYLNIRPSITTDMFYFLLDEKKHGYSNYNYNYYLEVGQTVDCRGDNDLDLGKPLMLGADWGSAINSVVITQVIGREFRALKNMYVLGLHKKNQTDLYNDFDTYYSYKKSHNNIIYLHYDNTGNAETGFTKLTRAQQVQQQLHQKGWKVILVTQGRANPLHEKKFRLWEMMLKEDNARLPLFRINIYNCRELLIAMQHAKTKERSDIAGIKKDKSSERSIGQDRIYATDLTDALDSVMYQKYSYLLSTSGLLLPPDRVIS